MCVIGDAIWSVTILTNLTGTLSILQEQSDRNFFISCKTSELVIGRIWKDVSLSSGRVNQLEKSINWFCTGASDSLHKRSKVGIHLLRVDSQWLQAGVWNSMYDLPHLFYLSYNAVLKVRTAPES